MTAHAYALLDSYVYGFALQEAALPFEGPDTVAEVAGPIMELMAAGDYPHLVGMATSYYLQPGYDFGDEFRFGLDLVLDGIERRLPPGPRALSVRPGVRMDAARVPAAPSRGERCRPRGSRSTRACRRARCWR